MDSLNGRHWKDKDRIFFRSCTAATVAHPFSWVSPNWRFTRGSGLLFLSNYDSQSNWLFWPLRQTGPSLSILDTPLKSILWMFQMILSLIFFFRYRFFFWVFLYHWSKSANFQSRRRFDQAKFSQKLVVFEIVAFESEPNPLSSASSTNLMAQV